MAITQDDLHHYFSTEEADENIAYLVTSFYMIL